MKQSNPPLLSVVVPVFNEGAGLKSFHNSLIEYVKKTAGKNYEIIYVDDGSGDNSIEQVEHLAQTDKQVSLIVLSRNFGKEAALTAGIAAASGQATLTIDADGQHPVELIPQFVEAWQAGAQVVVGIRANEVGKSRMQRVGSGLFYKLFNRLAGQKLIAGSTDFRLISQPVREAFLTLKESDRITRGLIDWLGFKREFISFDAKPRTSGQPGYSSRKLAGLAMDSIISLTLAPLYLFGYLGVFITGASFVLGVAVIVEQLILEDPLHWNFTGTAMLAIMLLFLVGLVLMSQGILSLYISHIQNQTKQRPVYVVDKERSINQGSDRG